MANLSQIGVSGLTAFRNGLNVVANNLANIYNEDYVLRSADFVEKRGNGFGSGIELLGITRVTDNFLINDIRRNESIHHYHESINEEIGRLVGFISTETSSVSRSLEDFSNALQTTLDDPTSTPSRSVLLNNATGLVNRFNALDTEFNNQLSSINENLSTMTQTVSQLTSELANINNSIARSTDLAEASLLDQRDAILKELSTYVSIRVLENSDQTVDVNLINGISLVLGSNSFSLTTQINTDNPRVVDVFLTDGNINSNITDIVSGGRITGLLDYRKNTVEANLDKLGLIAIGVADQYNRQHQLGMDLDGNLGGNFFTDINSTQAMSNRVVPSFNNANSATMAVSISDVSQLQAADYRLDFTNATDYNLVRNSDNTTVASGAIGGFPHAINADGFTINITAGTFAANERYNIRPVRDGAREINTQITDPRDVALAAPIRTRTNINNTGSGSIDAGVVTDATNAAFTTTQGQLTPPIRIEFLSANTYQIVNDTSAAVIEGPIAFTPGSNNAVFPTPGAFDPGYRVNINGAPSTGDRFYIEYNTNGIADNRNGLLLDDLKDLKILENNTQTFSASYVQVSGEIASSSHFTQLQTESSDILLESSLNRFYNVSGVNEEEEASKLLIYQKGFEAMARFVSISQQILDEIIGLVR